MKRERVHLESSADKAVASGVDPILNLLGKSFEEKPIWMSFYEDFRDAMFPAKLPPLELTSTPIPAPDRMAVKTNPWAIGTATLANGGLLAILLLLGFTRTMSNPPPHLGDNIRLKDFTITTPSWARTGGGSGGSNDLTDPITGRPPKQAIMPILPPQVPVLDNPRLPMDPAIAVPPEIKLPDNPSLPNIGVHSSPNVSLVSYGPGESVGIGKRTGGGDGSGDRNGYGPGSGPGAGDSIYTAGVGGVTNPIPIVSPEAEFSDEARRSKYQGVVMIAVVVDAHGFPRNPRVTRSLGMGLDEKALEAVQRYRFKPAMKDGKPVAAMITVEVNFRLY